MFDMVSLAYAQGSINLAQPFQNFHGSLMMAGGSIFAVLVAWMAIEYRVHGHVDHLMGKAVPTLISGGVFGYSTPMGQALVAGGGAAGATLAPGVVVMAMSEVLSDAGAAYAYWLLLTLPAMMLWKRIWH